MVIPGAVIGFGPYRLDRAGGHLLRAGTPVRLRPKVFAVLEYLALRPGRLVASMELLDAVWPATHVTPSVLAGCIRELRHALGDDARNPRFVETAHRRGYRFVAEPTADAPGGPRGERPGRDTELAMLARRFAEAVAGIVERGGRERGAASGVGQEAARGPRRVLHRGRKRTGRRMR